MFKGTDVVATKDLQGNPIVQEYERVWYEFGPDDESEQYTKTIEKKEVQLNGSVWKGIRPKDQASKYDVPTLYQQMLDDLKVKYPGSAQKPLDPNMVVIKAVSRQLNTDASNDIRAGLKPRAPMTAEEARTKHIATLKAQHPDWSAEKINKRVELLMSDED